MLRRPQILLQGHLFLVLQLHMSQSFLWHMQVPCKQPCVVKGWCCFGCHWAKGGLHSRGRAFAGGLSRHNLSSDVDAAALLVIFALVDDVHASLVKVDKAVLLHAGCLPGSARGSSSGPLSKEHIPDHIPEASAWSWQCREES